MGKFILTSDYKPTGDQPEAIRQLTEGLERGDKAQVLLGVTGSGKTFTMANVIANRNRPTLILSHNKTLAAQLYEEMKGFFPQNAVEYYVSYYDYYQPEAYLPATDLYIEKDLSINDEIDRLRLSAVSNLLSGRNDVIVVSSVSCIYGMGSPVALQENVIELHVGQKLDRNALLRKLVQSLYIRNDIDLQRGNFRVKGDTVDIAMAYSEVVLRVTFWDDEIDAIEEMDSVTFDRLAGFEEYKLYPANLFMTSKEQTDIAIREIQDDLMQQVAFFQDQGDEFKAARIKERVEYDMEMIKELGHCSGIENYSRYFDGRKAGERPYCLLDFFPDDYLLFIDESHVTVPQINAMYGGDRSRKSNLVEYGFRLPAAFDNRPLKFEEFQEEVNQVIYVSATPADYELAEAEGIVVEQVIRPTGLLDPEIEVRPSENQIDDLLDEILTRSHRNERVLVTTLTKRMAEEMCDYLVDDKEGFLRSHRSLTQTAGRAARNVNGKVIMYADTITASMQLTIDETRRRREKQLRYNEEHHITPKQIVKNLTFSALQKSDSADVKELKREKGIAADGESKGLMAADPIIERMTRPQLEKALNETIRLMKEAAKRLDFMQAAQYRNEMVRLQQELELK